MRKRRNDYDQNVHKAITWWREDYKEALRHSFEPWDLWSVETWERRVGLVGGILSEAGVER
jgi:hypothetical protein